MKIDSVFWTRFLKKTNKKFMNVRCIIKNKNKVLLCFYKKGNYYFLPGGSIEFQEVSTDTIYRELEEELGLKKSEIKILGFRAVVENIFEKSHAIDLVYNVSISRHDIESKEDIIKFSWCDIKELDKLDLRPNIMKTLIRSEEGVCFVNCDK